MHRFRTSSSMRVREKERASEKGGEASPFEIIDQIPRSADVGGRRVWQRFADPSAVPCDARTQCQSIHCLGRGLSGEDL